MEQGGEELDRWQVIVQLCPGGDDVSDDVSWTTHVASDRSRWPGTEQVLLGKEILVMD